MTSTVIWEGASLMTKAVIALGKIEYESRFKEALNSLLIYPSTCGLELPALTFSV